MSNIVITGALGHIGSKLIRELPQSFPGKNIIMLDNISTQRYSSLFSLDRHQYQFKELDVSKDDLSPFIKKGDVVIHLAAITNAEGSFEIKEKIEQNNFDGTCRVAEACAEAGAKIFYVSSTSVYGTQNDVVNETCTEEELKPQSPYAETKLKEERLLKKLGQEKGLRYIVCRFGTIFGASPGMRFHTAVNKFCWQAVMDTPLTVWRTALNQKRPYLALSDAVRAIGFIIENDLFDAQIYNVLTLNATVSDIIEIIKKYVPTLSINFVDTKIMNQLSYNVANKKFTDKGFTFTGGLESDIATTIQLLKNSNFYS